MRFILLFVVLASAAFAQLPVSVGLKAGYVNNTSPGSEILPFKGGPYLELSLPILPTFETGFMVERYRSGTNSTTVYQIPVLIKQRLNLIALKPFFAGGVTFRRIPEFDKSHPGLTVAAGVTLGLLPIKIEPELRFTRWIRSSFTPRSNQTEFLIGIRF